MMTNVSRFRTRALAAMFAICCLLAGALAAEAGPQHRLRRWSTRPPIDPTIRSTVAFGTPNAQFTSNTRRPVPVYRGYRLRRR